MKKKYRFKISGVSPEIGEFKAKEERMIESKIGDVFVSRGVASEVIRQIKKDLRKGGGSSGRD